MGSSTQRSERSARTALMGLAGTVAVLAFGIGLMFLSGSREKPGAAPDPPVSAQPGPGMVAGAGATESATGEPNATRLAGILADKSRSFGERREAAVGLANLGTPQASAELIKGLRLPGSAPLTSVIADLLARSNTAAALQTLREAVRGEDEVVAGAAIRALAGRGEGADAELLGEVLLDPEAPEGVRAEAALGLGKMPGPEALNALARAAAELKDESLAEEIWRGLGERPFKETELVFQALLNDPNTPTETKVMALESLSASEGDVSGFVLNFLSDPDAEIRRAAASALGATEMTREQVDRVLHSVGTEPNAGVRGRLYEALAMQDPADPDSLLRVAQAEQDPGATLALYHLVAAAAQQGDAGAELLGYFEAQAVPDLERRALGNSPYDQRVSSVLALGRAGTPSALAALQKIAAGTQDAKLAEMAVNAMRGRRGP